MAKLLLSCVGNRDPFILEGVKSFDEKAEEFWRNEFEKKTKEGPILSFIKKKRLGKSDKAILFYTKQAKSVQTPTEKGALATKQILCSDYGWTEENIRLIALNEPQIDHHFNPSDPTTVLTNLRQALQKNLINDQGEEIWVNYSPGTPQMQTAWFLLVNSGFLKAKLFRAEGEEIEAEPLFEDQFLNEACHLTKICDFGAAAELFKSLSKRAVIKERISIFRIFASLNSALNYWDSFDYPTASNEFGKVFKKLEGLQKTKRFQNLLAGKGDVFKEFSEYLQQINSFFMRIQNDFSAHLADIYENSARHYHRKRYHETVWKLDVLMDFAVIEKTLREIENYFDEKYTAKNFYAEVDDGGNLQLQQIVNNLRQRGVIYRDLREKEAKKILKQITTDSVWRIIESFDRKTLSDTRNKGLHYAKPISVSEAYKSLENSCHFVEALLDEEILSNYGHPLSIERIEHLAESMREIGRGMV